VYVCVCVCVNATDTCLQDMIEEFMGKLTRHSEQSLRFLRFRLDFNEYYSSTAGTPGSTPLKTHR